MSYGLSLEPGLKRRRKNLKKKTVVGDLSIIFLEPVVTAVCEPTREEAQTFLSMNPTTQLDRRRHGVKKNTVITCVGLMITSVKQLLCALDIVHEQETVAFNGWSPHVKRMFKAKLKYNHFFSTH